MKRKIALTGGGTAGHVTPNIALLPELKKRNYDIIYIGSKNGIEKDIIKFFDIKFFEISSGKLRRYHDFKNLATPFNVSKGFFEAKKILKNEMVDIIFSKGGYVSVPVVLAGHNLGIPVISHEADYTPGLANKISTPFSTKVCCSFPETAKLIKKNKGIFTGCPVRENIINGNKENGLNFLNFKEKKPILLVIGGSLGSIYINNLIYENFSTLTKTFNIVHSCGKGKLNKNFINDSYKQFEIITKELPDVYACSDLIISRSGANVIFELLALNIPNLLIPLSKKASRGDQILNANYFKEQNFSEVLFEEEQEKNKNLFLTKIEDLYKNKDTYIKNMKKANIKNSVKIICDIIDETT